jgi:phosphoglycerate dehydrogenase-like enzyme
LIITGIAVIISLDRIAAISLNAAGERGFFVEQLVCLLRLSEEYKARLLEIAKGRCNVEFTWRKQERFQELMESATILVGDPAAEDLRYCGKLKFMQTAWAGVAQYVNCTCFSNGAILCNMSGGYGSYMAEYVVGMVLALCRRFPDYVLQQREAKWQTVHYSKPLEDATVLILGAGDIGTEVAKRMRPLVKHIIGVRRVDRAVPPEYDEMKTLSEIDSLLSRADVVVAALPDTPSTRGLLDARRLRLMKPDAVLVNVGRGTLIVESELAEVMQEGRLFGVGLDVTTIEPLPKESPLWSQDRLLLTPHVSGNDFEPGSPAQQKIWDICLENVENYLLDRPLRNIVDFDTGYRKL